MLAEQRIDVLELPLSEHNARIKVIKKRNKRFLAATGLDPVTSGL